MAWKNASFNWAACIGVPGIDLHGDAGLMQAPETLPGDQRIRIFHGATTRSTPACDQSVDAGRRTALVRARLECHVKSSAARAIASLVQSQDLGVLDLPVGVESAPDDCWNF